jgi:DNA-binding transcriptional MerR regulator
MSEILMPPREAADRLGVSSSGLRRLASLYEGLYGPLPRDSSDSRIWPSDVVERLEVARALVSQGRAKSIQDALHAVETGDRAATDGLAPRLPQGEALAALVDEMQAMRRELAELRSESAAMRRQLEAPQGTSGSEPGLARMNAYLLGELERRRLEDETKKERRAWWQFW